MTGNAEGAPQPLAMRFEPPIDRTGMDSSKWEKYAGRDILPFWVADMDLPTAPFVLDAIEERLAHPILGYAATPAWASGLFVDWLERRYGWRVAEDWLVWLPGVVPGFNVAAQTVADDPERPDLVIPIPAYPPFLKTPATARLNGVFAPLVRGERWEMDFARLGKAISGRTAAFMLCNPQNPTGRVYDEGELATLAELILASGTVLVSDEIHCPLVLDAALRHVPIASLDEELAERSISLFASTKGYNCPGLGVAVAVVPNAALRERFEAFEASGLVSSISPLAYAAATAAFADTSDWLAERNAFLAENAAVLERAVQGIDGIRTTHVEGTCLAWLDTSALGLADPAAHFEAAGLGLSDGVDFGTPGFLRFNFGCPRSLLLRGIERLRRGAAAA